MATLTYSYRDSTIVVGPLSIYAEPHTYDLCATHADNVHPPRGWEVMRLDYNRSAENKEEDDLLALADAVREPRAHPEQAAALTASHASQRPQESAEAEEMQRREAPEPLTPPQGDSGIGRGHLRLVRE